MNKSNVGRTYTSGEVIIRQGEPGDSMFIVQFGTVEVIREQDGNELVIGTLSEGDFFGEMALFLLEPRSATVRAKDTARILTVDKATFLKRIQQDPSIALRILEKLSMRIKVLNEQLADAKRSDRDDLWF